MLPDPQQSGIEPRVMPLLWKNRPQRSTLNKAGAGCLRGVSLFLSVVRCVNTCRCIPNRR